MRKTFGQKFVGPKKKFTFRKSAYVIKTIFRDPETGFPFHPAAFASYQNSLKIKKKKVRSRLGPDGVPCKRKSREGTTTYLWEFLLKLLQVSLIKPM